MKAKTTTGLAAEVRGLRLRLAAKERRVEELENRVSRVTGERTELQHEKMWLKEVIDGLCAGLKYINGDS